MGIRNKFRFGRFLCFSDTGVCVCLKGLFCWVFGFIIVLVCFVGCLDILGSEFRQIMVCAGRYLT